MHHSDNAMDATSASRFHIGEITFSMILRLTIIYDITLLVCTLFHHANIALPYSLDNALRFITVTPFMHKVHHSRVKPETDSNFSSVLSVWDSDLGLFTTLFSTTQVGSAHRRISGEVETIFHVFIPTVIRLK